MVIDASALMAVLQREPGFDRVRAALEAGGLILGTVNRAEVKGKLVGSGAFAPQEVDARLDVLRDVLEIADFDSRHSDLAAYYYARRNPYSLSLGDCACLALAEARNVPVLTAEHAWAKLPDLPFRVVLIR
jgi:PIN domain nuclease of toxin-antitoxin system